MNEFVLIHILMQLLIMTIYKHFHGIQSLHTITRIRVVVKILLQYRTGVMATFEVGYFWILVSYFNLSRETD